MGAEAKGPKTCETDNDAFNRKIIHFEKYDAMETVSNVVQGTLPNYLKDLPIPKSVLGWFSLGILPFGIWNLAAVGGLSYVTLQALSNAPGIGPAIKDKVNKLPGFKPPKANHCIKLEESKVVDTLDIEDMGDKGVFCRCWKSKKFPYCDGSHNKHNQITGDNVG